jgi:hypothetical protein
MSYFNDTDSHNTAADKAAFYSVAVPECANCGTTAAKGAYLADYILEDGARTLFCEPCAEEERRIEELGDALAKLPGCAELARIVDTAATVRELVNRITAHTLTNCSICAAIAQAPALHERKAA